MEKPIRRNSSLSLRLTALVVACIAPVSLLAAFAVSQAYQQKQALIEQRMIESVRAAALTLDGALGDVRAALQVLATSPYLKTEDFAGLHAQSREVTKLFPGADIIMADRTGQQVLNSYRAFGDKLPKRNAPDLVRRVFESGRPAMGDVFLGAVTKRALVASDVPVMADGAVKYDLSMTFPAERLGAALERLPQPPGWTATILDGRRAVIAQIGAATRRTGEKAPEALVAAIKAAESEAEVKKIRTSGFDATPVFAVSAPLQDGGWLAVVTAPVDLIDGELRDWLLWAAAVVSALLAVGIGLALLVATRIARSIRSLTVPASALGLGERVEVADFGMREVDAVGEALAKASRLMAERGAQRNAAETALLEGSRRLQRQYDGLRALNDVAALPETDADRLLAAALTAGLRHLGLEIGIISRVKGRKYIVHRHVAPTESGLNDGATFELGETYCALTLDIDGVVAIPHMQASSYAGHPCYEKFRLESYIGAPLTVGGRPFGTVNFTSPAPAAQPFDEGDREFVRLLARWVGAVLERDRTLTELARSNAELEQFAYIASHDLREPLRQVSSYVTLLERRLEDRLDEETRGYLAVVRDGAKRMNRMILDVLDYSLIGRHDRPTAAVDLVRAAAEAQRNLASAIARAEAQVEIPDDLPTVGGDHMELVRLLQNLIDNAIKYRSPDRPPVVALSATRRDDGWWTVAVADNGLGIAPEHHQRIFLIFQRLHNRETHEGAGIGLAGAKKIVERSGGALWLESTPGVGSRFLFTLPPAPGDDGTGAP